MVLLLLLVLEVGVGVVLGAWEDWERFAFAGVYCWSGAWVSNERWEGLWCGSLGHLF